MYVALSARSLEFISSSVGLQGTGEIFKTPPLYCFLERYVPALLRSLTNVHIMGANKVPVSGPAIFCGNHLSNLDPFIKILAAQRPIHFMAKEGHFQKQPNRFVMISTGQIETFRETGGKDALARAVDVILQGGCLGIFPEGTRSRRTEAPFLQPGKTGFARLAAKFPNVPVVPITLSLGAREFMPPGSKLPRPWKKIVAIVDDPITFAEWASNENGGSIDDDYVDSLVEMDDDSIGVELRKLYRRFSDQLIETLRHRGAP
ncbi:MAG: hypothetical protein CMA88_03275 [Euryarchaeota archaeon]|nr:hypothetical protein [Euryarchaeota archaeon]|tara:strand:- start:708 stop:1490 length:783 start_codon:yes stop_codon:yes gene_type:complete